MPKYYVSLSIRGFADFPCIEAESEDDAVEIARSQVEALQKVEHGQMSLGDFEVMQSMYTDSLWDANVEETEA